MGFMMGGLNPSNSIPGAANNRPPTSGGNKTPKGNGGGNWQPSGRNSSRSARNAFNKRKRGAVSKRGTPKGRAASNAVTAKGGVSNTTALAKGLGGATAARGGFAFGGAIKNLGVAGLVAWVMSKIIDRGGVADGTIPEHIRDVGEQQKVGEISRGWYGGQDPSKSYILRYGKAVISGGTFRGWAEYTWSPPQGFYPPIVAARLLSGGVDYGEMYHWIFRTPANSSRNIPEGGNYGPYQIQTQRTDGVWINWIYTRSNGTKLIGFEPADGTVEDDNGTTPVNSESSVNHSNVSVSEQGTINPPGVRPPQEPSRTSNPPPSRGFDRQRRANDGTPERPPVITRSITNTPPGAFGDDDKRPRVVKPSANNSGNLETPPPPKKYTDGDNLDAGVIYKFGKVKIDLDPEPEDKKNYDYIDKDGNTIQVRTVKGADGSVRTVRTKKLSQEDIKKLGDKQKDGIEDKGWYKVNHDSFLDKYDPTVQADIDQQKQGEIEQEQVTETEKKPGVKFTEPNITPTPDGEPPKEPDNKPDPSPQPEPPEQQTPAPSDEILEKIKKLPELKDIAIMIAGLDIIKQIASKAGTASPICTAEALRPAINRNEATTITAQTAILGQGQVTQTAVNAANATLNHSTWGLQAIVTNSTYGLQRIQSFASTAWRAARGDKIMAGVSLALTVHNAMMLSNNLASTISEALNVTFDALGIRDETDNPIDIGAFVKEKVSGLLATILGAEEYAALTVRIAKFNRIYQASINLLDTTYSLFDSARTVAELTAEHMGQIGNALREAGAVYEDAYSEMTERINPQNLAMRRLGSFRDSIEVAEDAFDSVAQISSSVVEAKDNIEQIRLEKEELKTEIEGFVKEQQDEKNIAKEQAQVTTEVVDADFEPAQTEETEGGV